MIVVLGVEEGVAVVEVETMTVPPLWWPLGIMVALDTV